MLIVDAHLDIALNALVEDRDMLASCSVSSSRQQASPFGPLGPPAVAFPEMQQGRVALCFATLFARGYENTNPETYQPSFDHAFATARAQLAYYRAMEQMGHVRIIANPAELTHHIAEWHDWDKNQEMLPASPPPVGMVFSIEGADPILSPGQLSEWWELGVRLLGLAHLGEGRYCGGTGSEQGLTKLGRQLLHEMALLDMPLDLSHSSETAFWDSLSAFDGAVFASHSNCRTLVPHPRQLSDHQILALLQRGGVIGVAVANWMMVPGWRIGQSSNQDVSLSVVADHIDHICQLAGNSRQVGLGTDLDGGFGRSEIPADVDSIADLQKLIGILKQRGYEETDVSAILCGNWVRFLSDVWV